MNKHSVYKSLPGIFYLLILRNLLNRHYIKQISQFIPPHPISTCFSYISLTSLYNSLYSLFLTSLGESSQRLIRVFSFFPFFSFFSFFSFFLLFCLSPLCLCAFLYTALTYFWNWFKPLVLAMASQTRMHSLWVEIVFVHDLKQWLIASLFCIHQQKPKTT